jgi:hypothetical protein
MLLAGSAVLAVSGCGGTTAQPAATRTVTATATVTATVTATATPTAPVALPPALAPSTQALTTAPPPRLRLTVFDDGCGVIRSDSRAGAYLDLTWVFRDSDGFQVLGRNAEGETRYRYFRPGAYTVTLEAFGQDHYVPVSNTVTVHC